MMLRIADRVEERYDHHTIMGMAGNQKSAGPTMSCCRNTLTVRPDHCRG